jgi:hypothetical protein
MYATSVQEPSSCGSANAFTFTSYHRLRKYLLAIGEYLNIYRLSFHWQSLTFC